VKEEVAKEFINAFTAHVFNEYNIGDPMLDTTKIGPLALNEYPEILDEICEDARSLGADILVGGNMNTDDSGLGRFFEPTIIHRATVGMRVMHEQIGGPVVGIQRVTDHRMAMKLMNNVSYSLSAYVFTGDEEGVFKEMEEGLKVGTVLMNVCPVMHDVRLPITGRKQSLKTNYLGRNSFLNLTRAKVVGVHSAEKR